MLTFIVYSFIVEKTDSWSQHAHGSLLFDTAILWAIGWILKIIQKAIAQNIPKVSLDMSVKISPPNDNIVLRPFFAVFSIRSTFAIRSFAAISRIPRYGMCTIVLHKRHSNCRLSVSLKRGLILIKDMTFPHFYFVVVVFAYRARVPCLRIQRY